MPKKEAPLPRAMAPDSGRAAGCGSVVARFVPRHREGRQGHDVPWYFPNTHGMRAAQTSPEEDRLLQS